MSINKYSNFVRPSSPSEAKCYSSFRILNGEEAKKLYLEEVQDIGDPEPTTHSDYYVTNSSSKRKRRAIKVSDPNTHLTDKDLFLSAQNNDVDILKRILDKTPDKINLVDDYGWSLLMIACQACSIEAVIELLGRNINTDIRDKSGNSAHSLVIRNRNLILADLLLTHKKTKHKENEKQLETKKVKLKEEFYCNVCSSKTYADKEEHLSSTIHNINASKGKKIPAHYVIPASNKGYQLMLKDGWDRESGLGPNGSGKRYPIKTLQKKDRKGLGIVKAKQVDVPQDLIKKQNKRVIERDHRNSRRREIDFRREFY